MILFNFSQHSSDFRSPQNVKRIIFTKVQENKYPYWLPKAICSNKKVVVCSKYSSHHLSTSNQMYLKIVCELITILFGIARGIIVHDASTKQMHQ